ncbi:hypothetical protein MFLAVUS_003356 [Mucor flavus]|uniref:Uncharacterized protein n=1 Tax=Mucor flavus TaxID=439312 RepID=A0ABP9YSV0_9FUNG
MIIHKALSSQLIGADCVHFQTALPNTEIEVKVESFDAFHYAFILPSEWEKEIRENLLRPMFIQGDLLHEGDHEDRLLFFSDIECICYRLENINNDNHYFERGNDAIICRFAPIENDNFLVKLDLVHTMNPLYNFPNSRLFPKVKRSSSFYIDDTDIQCCIKSFLEEKLLPIDQDHVMEALATYIYYDGLPDQFPQCFDDISLKSTLLSCALLDDHGLVEEVFDHSYFTQVWMFIQFAESYLLGNNFCADKNATVKENIISEIETILNVDYSSGAVLISTQQQVYLKAFFLMYMVYIKESISSNLPVRLTAGNDNINIGYVVSIEMILLDNIIGTKDDLRDIIYTSGLTHSEDNSKKLRIITQGEGYLPTIKEKLKLKLQLGSNFVLVQLHEDYIQLTLNQVVTESDVEDKEEEQESIILLDKIIHVQNLFAKTSDWKDTDVDLIQLGDTCGCHIFLTVEDILDISFKPVIQDIVSLLSASLPFMYEGFRIGTLHQVYSSNCASFLLESSDEKLLLCKTKKSDTKGTALDGWTGHLLIVLFETAANHI